ncbi:MAG: C40 family peptidase [Clostridia bacterium]|nr:C40 family peptidase [Clostridia bacterium]
MKDKKSMSMIIIVGVIISLFLFVNTTVFATTGTVVTSDLRLRKEESTSSEVLDLLDENDKVEIISENGDWYKVKANGKVGYVSKEYIKLKDENNQNTENTNTENKNETEEKTDENSEEKNTSTENTSTENTSAENITEENTNKENTKEEHKQEVPSKYKFATDVQLKVMPVINGIVINSTNADEEYDVVSSAGVWSYVKSGNKAGWVLTEKLTAVSTEKAEETKPEEKQEEKKEENQQEEQNQEKKEEEKKSEEPADTKYSSAKTYYVKGTSVNARSKASKDSEVVKVLNTNNSVKVTGENGSWYVVEINGEKAYISKSLLSKEKVEVTSRSSNSLSESNNQQPAAQAPEQPVASNPSGAAIVQYAKTFLGYRYVYGTAGPNTFDCSGFVQYVYKHFGYSLSRSSGTQANDGVAVSKSNLQPGDVLIFRDTSNSRIGHVGIYIGDGQFIHASNSRTGVIISSLSTNAYQKRYVGARRIL